jgi:hypothetical protein
VSTSILAKRFRLNRGSLSRRLGKSGTPVRAIRRNGHAFSLRKDVVAQLQDPICLCWNPARVLALEKPGFDQPISDKTVWIACGDACNVAAESSSLWHCPRYGVSMIVVHRFTAAELSASLTSILRGVSTSCGPGMCSRTATHSYAYPTATGSRTTICPHSCRHVRRYQRSRPGLSASPALAPLELAGNWRSNPIAHRVRGKRQRFPPSLLSEDASHRDPRSTPRVCSEAFPIKASDQPETAHSRTQRELVEILECRRATSAGKSTLLRSSCGCPSLAHSPYGPYRVVSALASTTAELRAACS